MMTFEQYQRRVHVRKFLRNSFTKEIKEELDGFAWEALEAYAAEATQFEKAPAEERE